MSVATNKGESMSPTLMGACRFILEDQGEALSSYWFASIVLETNLWWASESQVHLALDGDIEDHDEDSPSVKVAEDLYALRSWKAR
jgi:hypothetical protein